MAHQSFAKKVLETVATGAAIRGGEIDTGELSVALFIQTRAERKRMLGALNDLAKSGRIVRIRRGVYGIGAKSCEVEKREIMWRTFRMRKVVTIEDLQEFAGCSHSYAKQWLAMLVKRNLAIRIDLPDLTKPRSWRLVCNDLEMPVDEEKAKKLQKIRQDKKKKIKRKLAGIERAVADIRADLEEMEE